MFFYGVYLTVINSSNVFMKNYETIDRSQSIDPFNKRNNESYIQERYTFS